MSSGIWIAASGASAQMTALDVTANNLANATTPGFKADQAVFQEHLVQALVAGKAQPDMRYTSVAAVTPDLRSGPLQVTQRPLDAAIDGDGYFTVQTPRGERYTRAGGFQLGPAGTLVTALGYAVLDSGGSPIQLPLDGPPAEIGQDGAIRIGDEEVGRLGVVSFAQPRALAKDGDTLFRATPQAGQPEPTSVTLQSGALELPNVSIVKGMTDLVSATRAFEALERAVEAYSDLERRAASDIVGAR
ncbi:MAG: flagellar basal-body rod protein FlgF [Deltaproteobacteria bacterium]